ncbi:hypothetical protein BD324DRAFT_611003 [Kockovaella imperatae]|uniref:Transcription initiation factor IIE subunit beta n=1 Tax=Kockovaella imperatae TaxID=4999 RepID=A0A1Y1UR15_9TREE|nr:hypothetical protein BD324DRAFT_611003 [Kockovaella imperatae]ORX40493.1 hypothetical protein BD324DRAFT_611003 [Kockovaella imperatae]
MQPMKRKTPSGHSPSPAPGSGKPFVKPEPVEHEVKKQRFTAGPSFQSGPGTGSSVNALGTAVMQMSAHLKAVGTLGYQDAYFHAQAEFPSHDPVKVLEMLKRLERVIFNDVNQVFSYNPELTLANEAQIRGYIRTNSTPTQPVLLRSIREALPPNGTSIIEDLERRGEIQVMRSLTGQFKDPPLPRLGRKNILGLKINDSGNGGSRMRSLWWDDLRERDRAGKRADDDFIFAWDDVVITEADDIVRLLEKENLGAGSAMPAAPKIVAQAPAKKKKTRRGPLKISNVHMKEQGIDFSKDYEGPS